MDDTWKIENPLDLVQALAQHPYPDRCKMIANLLRGKTRSVGLLHRRARFVTLLRERELWPMSPR